MRTITLRRPASEGLAIGPVLRYRPPETRVGRLHVAPDDVDAEVGRFLRAVAKARDGLAELAGGSEIFAAHLDIIDDPVIIETVRERITKERANAAMAVEDTVADLVQTFEAVEDEYLKERIDDIRDVWGRVTRTLLGVTRRTLADIAGPAIVVAQSLAPSDVAGLDPEMVLGLVSAEGGDSGHVAIMARTLGIPAVVGVGAAVRLVPDGVEAVLDAVEGLFVVEPDEATSEEYRGKIQRRRERLEILSKSKGLPAETTDGRRVAVCANVGTIRELEAAVRHGVDGVGLLRTELMYLESDGPPAEGELLAAYKAAARLSPGELIIRTLDAGGDKPVPWLGFEAEENPFLGWRGIRSCLDLKDVFKTQLRAILRASAFGNVKIMFPMIVDLEEFLRAKEILGEAMRELDVRDQAYDPDVAVGAMIETPAAVAMAPELAEAADFLSLGTNDLTQYTLAVDRGNQRVAALYDQLHPSVIRAVDRVARAGRAAGIPVGMCGDLAGDPRATALLVGLGLDELSVAAARAPETRSLVRSLSMAKARELAAKCLKARTSTEVESLILER